MVLTLVFLVAMLAVSIATQVLVPILLTVLSLFVARQALRSAVDTVRAAGHHAVDAMDRVRRGGDADEPWEPEEDDEEEERREKRRR